MPPTTAWSLSEGDGRACLLQAPFVALSSMVAERGAPMSSSLWLRRTVVAGIAIHVCGVLRRGSSRICHTADVVVERAEWGAGISAAIVTSTAGVLAVRRTGARPLLAVGFMVMPSLYALLARYTSLEFTLT